ncbi:hypothetical protein GCM10011390_44200 [Aureimonas endophytica]|uniref:Uncharacterized protein n=1 Tax=Aureimonas endophytica TaxID=2027858 RepID=A0A916ZZL3_9HYPH|nr:hypothetical protein [Aureimonas endophytica]GGE20111.1 hypothetical protein GCM10011390_44200 [Aureimonas endophytica]
MPAIPDEVFSRCRRAADDGKRYLLFCMDVYDRLRGDGDLGYYYPALATAADVAQYLEEKQLGDWNTGNSADVCWGIFDLSATSGEISADSCTHPLQWMQEFKRARESSSDVHP